MGMSESDVFRAYGRTMVEVQRFELSLRGLAVSLHPALRRVRLDFDEVWRRVEPLLSGRTNLRDVAGKVPADAQLAADIETAINTRNTLAHEYLLLFRMRNTLEDDWGPKHAVSELRDIERRFIDVTQRVDGLDELIRRERGGPTDDEIAEALSSDVAKRLWALPSTE